MGAAIQKYQADLNRIAEKRNEIKQIGSEIKTLHPGATDNGSFYSNPMRGIPFWHRWKPGFDFETYRATERQPAILKSEFSLAYQQNSRLQTGLGAFFNLGLGKDFRHIHFTGQGIGINAFVGYDFIYGFGLEGGYERSWGLNFEEKTNSDSGETESGFKSLLSHANQNVYIGIKKTYRINEKWFGELLFGYNFLWNKNELRTPWIIRVGWRKK